MSYPHLRHEPVSIGTASVCRCGDVAPTLGAKSWGEDCPAAMRERLAEVDAERDAALAGTVDAEVCARVGVLLEDKVTLRGEAAAMVTALFVRFPALLPNVLRRLGWDDVAAHTARRLATAQRDVASLRGEVERLEGERDAARDEAQRLRALGASTHKAVAAAVEARAVEIEAEADKYKRFTDRGAPVRTAEEEATDIGVWTGLQLAARIVRGQGAKGEA